MTYTPTAIRQALTAHLPLNGLKMNAAKPNALDRQLAVSVREINLPAARRRVVSLSLVIAISFCSLAVGVAVGRLSLPPSTSSVTFPGVGGFPGGGAPSGFPGAPGGFSGGGASTTP